MPRSQDAQDQPDGPRSHDRDLYADVQYVRLAQSTGWTAMAATMREYDEEKVRSIKEDIDTLLVFAGLFSAVLTAFVIESYQRLVPDTTSAILATTSTSLAVMQQISLQISNSSYRPLDIDAGNNLSPFQPTTSDIRTNVLWFASLVFSLVTASFGILVKQWLREYMAFESSTPQARLRVRHYRYLALQQWQVFEIAAVLPLFQQLALGLFFFGLCYFTASVHESTGRTTLPLVSAWAFLFITVTLLPAFFPQCPYKTTFLKSVFVAANFCIVRTSARLATYRPRPRRLKKGVVDGHPNDSEGPHDRPLRSAREYLLRNDEIQIANQDTADLTILGDADELQSNDDLLGTTIFESLKQIHEPTWIDVVNFVFRLVDHRLPLGRHPRAQVPQLMPLRALSRSAYIGVLDIISHYLRVHLENPASSDPLERDATQRALLLFFSESRYPLPDSGTNLLRCDKFHSLDVLRLLVHNFWESAERIESLILAISRVETDFYRTPVSRTDTEDFLLTSTNIYGSLVDGCLQLENSSERTCSLRHILEAIDRMQYSRSYRCGMLKSIVRGCLRSRQPAASFQDLSTAIDKMSYGVIKYSDTLSSLAEGCLQSDRPTLSLYFLLTTLMLREHDVPHGGSTSQSKISAVTHACLKSTEPTSSLQCLLSAVYPKKFGPRRSRDITLSIAYEALTFKPESTRFKPTALEDTSTSEPTGFTARDSFQVLEKVIAAIFGTAGVLVGRSRCQPYQKFTFSGDIASFPYLSCIWPKHICRLVLVIMSRITAQDVRAGPSESTPPPLAGALAFTWHIVALRSEEELLTYDAEILHETNTFISRALLQCLYEEEYMAALLRALHQMSDRVVISVCSNFDRAIEDTNSDVTGFTPQNLNIALGDPSRLFSHLYKPQVTPTGFDTPDSIPDFRLAMINYALRVICFVVHVALALRKSVSNHVDDWKELFKATTRLLYHATGRYVGLGSSFEDVSLSEELALVAAQTFATTSAQKQLSQAAQRSCLPQESSMASESTMLAQRCLDQITAIQWAVPIHKVIFGEESIKMHEIIYDPRICPFDRKTNNHREIHGFRRATESSPESTRGI